MKQAVSSPETDFGFGGGLVVEAAFTDGIGKERLGRVPGPVGEEPRQNGDDAADDFFHHSVVVEHRSDEHDVPEQLEHGHSDEEKPDGWGESVVEVLEGLQVVIFEGFEWIDSLGVVVSGSVVLLVAKVFFDVFPANDGSCFFHQYQTGVDEDEGVSGDVESTPQVAGLKATRLGVKTTHAAPSIGRFDNVEEFGPDEPKSGGDTQPWQMVPDKPLVISAADRNR